LFSQFYNPIVCLDIKDYDVCDLNPSNDHVFFDIIVCHQFPVIPMMMFLHMLMILSLVLILNFPIYPTHVEVCQRSRFLEVDDRELENVNMGNHRSNKDVEI
jgi:hypothetical protein